MLREAAKAVGVRRLDRGLGARFAALAGSIALVIGPAGLSLRVGVAYGEQGSLSEFPSAIAGGAGGAPLTLAAGPEGQMWATESGGKIVRFSSDGKVTGEFAPVVGHAADEPEVSHPGGLAVARDGSVWFTDSGTNAEGHSFIGRISPSNLVSEFKIPDPELIPQSITEGSDGNLWFTELAPTKEGEGAIGRITPGGNITEFPIPSIELSGGTFDSSKPGAITLGSDGDIWFADDGPYLATNTGQVGRITPEGVIKDFGDELVWSYPIAIALGGDGNIWYTDTEERLGRITPGSEPPETFFPLIAPSYSNRSLALGPDGNLWLSGNESANSLTRIAPTGERTEFASILPDGGYPNAIAFDDAGHLWFGESKASKIWRWNTPRVAADETPPEISGIAAEGQTVVASTGRWALEPGSFRFQWQSCSATGIECTNLAGEAGAEHFVTSTDVGHTLRAVVTAVSLGGSSSATSSPSAQVAPAPQPAVTLKPQTPTAPGIPATPVVDATMTWRFAWSTSYTLIKSLAVHSIPSGATVTVRCSGRGCPFRTRASRITSGGKKEHGKSNSSDSIGLTAWFAGRHLAPAVKLTVQVTKPGWIGKSFRFVTRAGRPPRVVIECAAAVSKDQGSGC